MSNVGIVREPLQLILNNGQRLVEDAQLLLAHGRYASATMLALYSVEELGKHFQAKWRVVEEHSSKRVRVHASKQGVLGIIYCSGLAGSAVRQILTRVGLPEKLASDGRYPYTVINWLRGTKHGRALAGPFENALERAITGSLLAQPGALILEQARLGEIEQIKRSAIYVDVGQLGEVTSNPATITAEVAKEWVGHAQFLLHAAAESEFAGPVVDIEDVLSSCAVTDVADLMARERPFDDWQRCKELLNYCPKCGVADATCDHTDRVNLLVEPGASEAQIKKASEAAIAKRSRRR
jgi:hypothetical protein